MSQTFVHSCDDILWRAWCVTLWTIHDVPLMDRYGFTKDHPNFTLELDDDYVGTLPEQARSIAIAMQYSEQWHIDWREILDMKYDEFYESMMVTKAITYKRPWWTGAAGENAFALEKLGHKRLNKPRRRTQ